MLLSEAGCTDLIYTVKVVLRFEGLYRIYSNYSAEHSFTCLIGLVFTQYKVRGTFLINRNIVYEAQSVLRLIKSNHAVPSSFG